LLQLVSQREGSIASKSVSQSINQVYCTIRTHPMH